MNIPASLRAGDTWSWTESLADYPAPTYTLKFSLWKLGEAVKTITASASGTGHAIAVAVATSIGFEAGAWKWTAYAEKGSDATLERYTIDSGEVLINPCLASTGSTSDLRSHAQIMLDAIEATLRGRERRAELSLSVNGKAIQYMKYEELEAARATYTREVAAEKAGERGEGTSKITKIQF